MKIATFEAIFADPQVFDAELIEIHGFFVCERENCAVYPSKDYCTSKHGLWLGNGGNMIDSAKHLNRTFVQVAGIYRNNRKRGVGHFNRWSGEIRKITKLEPRVESK
jgi:hypothetical protein